MAKISTKQRILAYRAKHPDATIRGIQKALRISSPSVVQFHLKHVSKKQSALLEIADEIEALRPIPSTFKGMNAIGAAKVTLRMCAQLIRDRVNGGTSRDRQATKSEISEMRSNAYGK